MRARAVGLLLGYAADRVFGDPQRFHPVAGFGTTAQRVERLLYADSLGPESSQDSGPRMRARGVAHTAVLVGGTVAIGVLAERRLPRLVSTAVATWAVLGGRSLEREAVAVHTHLIAGDLPAARQRLTHLVGRDTAALDESEVARAVIESVAENTSDAVVAPLVWGALCGVPGLLGYRAVNTLDAMVGHHNARYEHYGRASAKLDDLANLPGSRLSGILTMAVAPGRAREAARTWRRDAGSHPSPNGGVVESTFAGVLGIRLGGTNTYYGDRIEHRAVMGDGRAARPDDIARATSLAQRIGLGAVLAAAGVSLCLSRPIRRWGPLPVR